MANVLYRFYGTTGQLLYVGITINPAQRFKDHRDSKDWWDDVAGITLERYATRKDLAAAERRAIEVERPLHNIARPKVKGVRSSAPPPTTPESLVPEPAPAECASGSVALDRIFANSHSWVEEVERRELERERAKWQARRDCPLCDNVGYRGRVVCDHVERSGESRWRAARKRNLAIVGGV